jgi:hypothetical protein
MERLAFQVLAAAGLVASIITAIALAGFSLSAWKGRNK